MPMIPVKEAVVSASAFVASLYPNPLDVRLEQVEKVGRWWRVVLSFKASDANSLGMMLGQPNRLFKEIDVDMETGEAEALRMFKA